MEEDKLEAQMEYAKYEHETEMLRVGKIITLFLFCSPQIQQIIHYSFEFC